MDRTIKRTISTKNFRDLEQRINERLKAIDKRYMVRHLFLAPDGKYRFELSVAIDPRHQAALQRVLREVLRELPADRPVQAKFYLPESIARRVKEIAEKREITQSALVVECLKSVLSA
jgi:hypothetical protein